MVVAFDIETTGLDPYESKVILVGAKDGPDIKMWKLWKIPDEGRLILSAIDYIEEIDETIVGFNNLKFDVPFMLERLRILKLWKPSFWEIFSRKWFDLYQYLGNDFRSLRYWLVESGIKRSTDLLGRDIPTLYERREFDKIEAHNLDDLKTSEQLFLYLKEKNPKLLPFD